MDETTRILSDLVAIKSVNPMGRPLSGPGYNELEMARYVEAFLKDVGVDAQRQVVEEGRLNVFGIVEGEDDRERILFEAHTDTVSADTWEGDPFKPVIREGRLYGRGSCDDKASVAAMLVAVKRLVQRARKPPHTIVVLASCDEESSFRGAREFLKLNVPVTMAVVGEPTCLDIVIAHKGAVRWRIRCEGKSAHSARPHEGVSAIYRMARVLLLLEEYGRRLQDQTPHPLLGTPTLSVGLIQGGQTVNTVPDLCEIDIDRRTLPSERPEQAVAAVKDFIRTSRGLDFDPVFVEPHLGGVGLETPEDAAIVQRLKRVCNEVIGRSKVRGVSYGTDASAFAAAGIQCVVFGPGDIRQAHAVNEFVDLGQVRDAADVYFHLMTCD